MKFKTIVTSLLLAGVSTWAAACDNSEDSVTLLSKLSVVDVTYNFSESKDQAMISSFGSIKNGSGACADDLVIEAKYYDSTGKLVDVISENLYGVVIPAHQEFAFRVRGPADKPKASYAKAVVRVASVSPKHVPETKSEWSRLLELLYLLGPLILIIGVFEFFARKLTGKNSPQQRMVGHVELQTAKMERNIAALERIANALEKK